MASITYWSQLQPSPRTPSLAEGLAARVRDPAWLLARQWQLGEFQGLDGGSPAFVQIASRNTPIDSATIAGKQIPLDPGELLEPLIEAEPLAPDLATRVELGQTFEALIPRTLARLYRAAYPIARAGPDSDPAETRFRAIVAGRVTDGVALYQAATAAKAAHNGLPAEPTLDATNRPKALAAINAFIDWVNATWGPPAAGEPPGWEPGRLDYSASISAGGLTFSVQPDPDGALDWHAFDLIAGTPATTATTTTTTATTTSVIPGHIRFRGMPNPRWWDFESSATDFGSLLTDTRDLAQLLFADFLLIHGDDWYLARLDLPTGSLSWIDTLILSDVFGHTTPIPKAASADPGSWTIFSTSDQTNGGTAPFLVTPASAAAARQASGPLEELHLLRDETADMAWAIERVIQGPIGDPISQSPIPPAAAPEGAPAALAYQLATQVPANWFPLLPVTTDDGRLALIVGTVEGTRQTPQSRILQRLSAPDLELPQHEIPRSGLRLERIASRTRTPDGNAKLWIARRKHIGAGEASSGLRYDQAIPATENG